MRNTIILIGLIVFTSCSAIKLEHTKTLQLEGKICNEEIVNIDFYIYSNGVWLGEESKTGASKYEYQFDIEKDYIVVFVTNLGQEKILYIKHGIIDHWRGRLNISFKNNTKYAYLYQKNENEYDIIFSDSDDYMKYFCNK